MTFLHRCGTLLSDSRKGWVCLALPLAAPISDTAFSRSYDNTYSENSRRMVNGQYLSSVPVPHDRVPRTQKKRNNIKTRPTQRVMRCSMTGSDIMVVYSDGSQLGVDGEGQCRSRGDRVLGTHQIPGAAIHSYHVPRTSSWSGLASVSAVPSPNI
ncbi:hypothetical protein NEOLEDRAFT_981969 [Neolentinus lepideus HHB14362 ss-1]|uniref:Uncharacterized protein n=1 Tax=Neolentinus lepideus HHB14362 ss-1 TaxID=1314782 RepID=A0A165N7F9_9AGAM|nr:hypothetical protein NEOLEDRAFT_981969 [Neolentinus lepideus HHB14362 ss-1]